MHKLHMVIVVGFLVGVVLLPRIGALDAFRAPDEDRWMANTAGFTKKLAHGKIDQLIQQPHPGITTQWLGALTIRFDSWEIRKLPLVIGQSLLILLLGYLGACLWGAPTGIILTILLALNPQLIAHTRIYAMDSLMALWLLVSLITLLLWHKTQQTSYLIYTGAAGALSILSKLPGVIIIPYTLAALLYFGFTQKTTQTHKTLQSIARNIAIWGTACVIAAIVILPSFAIAPTSVMGDFLEFFRSDDYTELHPAGTWYYGKTLAFFTTPIGMAAFATLPVLWGAGKLTRSTKRQLLILLAFGTLFTLQMTLGAKKGDRYLLPVFLVIDVITAIVIVHAGRWINSFTRNERIKLSGTLLLTTAALAYLSVTAYTLHPYAIAYVNPLTKPFLNNRRTGWGEGLDQTAAYLNQKPNADHLKVATFYPTEFSHYFVGEAVPAHQWENDSIDYVVLYRAMFERGESAWETDVLNQFKGKVPEHIIRLNNIEYAWIYKKE